MALPAQQEIELPLLREIIIAGGEAEPADLYPRLRKYFPGITNGDLQGILPCGDNTWTNRIRWARKKLVLKGDLEWGPRGLWWITPQCEARVRGARRPS